MKEVIIFKVGSGELLSGQGQLNRQAITHLMKICDQARAIGWSPILVVSGAVAHGRTLLNNKQASRAVAAALGQAAILENFSLAAQLKNIQLGQVLCTAAKQDLDVIAETVRQLCELEIVPILNENDSAASKDHSFGNNDRLAAIIASALKAKVVCFFSSVGGVYLDFCSQSGCGNCLLEECSDCPIRDLISVDPAPSTFGAGGIEAKLDAIELLRGAEISSFVGALNNVEDFSSLISSQSKGTYVGNFWKLGKSIYKISIDDHRYSRQIDLRSDTITQPDLGMRMAISRAVVGDDCYNDDPSVQALEKEVASLFNVEQALFITSGTMSNQVALRSITEPGDEVITHPAYHINFFESAQTADLARVSLNCCATQDGLLRVKDVQEALASKPRGTFYAKAPLVWIENSVAAYGGKVYPTSVLEELSTFCRQEGLHLHMDGARIFNASAATAVELPYYAELVDSLSICFAKGLGAPFGSALCGRTDFIKRARKFRKWFGGGLHQAGFMAAAALYGLQNNLGNFAHDYQQSVLLEEILKEVPEIQVSPNDTNMLMFDISHLGVSAKEFSTLCEKQGVLLFPWSSTLIRATCHYGLNRQDVVRAGLIIKRIAKEILNKRQQSERASL